jgi:hypothetical protein
LHEAVYGAGGIACGDGKVLVVGGLPRGTTHNRIYELSSSLGFIAERRLDTGYTEEGIQVATFGDGSWWLGTYSGVAFRLESDLSTFRRFTFDASLGLASLGSGKYYVGRQTLANGHYENIQVVLATMDGDRELRLVTNGLVLKN